MMPVGRAPLSPRLHLDVKAGQFVVDLGAKEIHLKPVLELLFIGHQDGAGHDGLGLLLLQEHPFLLLLLGFKVVSRHSKTGPQNHVNVSPRYVYLASSSSQHCLVLTKFP